MRLARPRTVCVLSMLAGAMTTPAFAQPFHQNPLHDEVFYHFMPIAWADATNDPNRFGDFRGMTQSLDYLQRLGVTAVWINPIFISIAYHGYQHGPADTVNAWLGRREEFIDFVKAARERDIDVYLDFVAYGISHNSPWFKDAHQNPQSPFDAWLAFTDDANTKYQGYEFKTWSGLTVGFVHWDLRHEGPRALVADWGKLWLDPNTDGDLSDGVAGYRLDHVWETYPNGPEGWGYNLDTFWTGWKEALKTVNPGVITFAEQAQWETHGNALLGPFDGAFTKPFEDAARRALREGLAAPLYEEMDRTIASLSGVTHGTYLGIIGDHDVDRLASAIGADTPETIGRAKAAAAVLMLQPFPPVIYFGDEIGMLGVKGEFQSDANDIPRREPFKWKAVNDAPPMTNYAIIHQPSYQARFSRDKDGRSVEEQEFRKGSLLEEYKRLIALRRSTPALGRGDYQRVEHTDPRVWCFLRRLPEPRDGAARSVLVAINLGADPVRGTADLSPILAGGGVKPGPVRALGDAGPLPEVSAQNAGAYPIELAPHAWTVIEVGG